METNNLNELIMGTITAAVGGVTGWAAKAWAARSEAVQSARAATAAIKHVQESLQQHITFSDRMLEQLRHSNEECEKRARELSAKVREQGERIDELDGCVRRLTGIPKK